MRFSLVPVLLALCLPLLPWSARAQEVPFLLAVVRDDGVVVPVTTHDRGRWRMPWPGAAKEAEVPVRVDDAPLAWWGLREAPRTWTLHAPGEAPRAVTVDRPIWVPSYCQQQVALASRDAARSWWRQPDGLRAPTYGVAIAGGDAELTLPRAVPVESAEARALLDALQRTFNNQERLMLAGDYFAVYAPSVDGAQRDRMPVRALSIHAGPGADGEVYFVELERRSPRKQPEHLQWCDAVTFMAGWVRRAADGQLDVSLMERAVTSCLLDSVLRATPLAVVRTRKAPVWLVEVYRTQTAGYALYPAPTTDAVEPLAYRSMGNCVGRLPVQPPLATGVDVEVP